MLMLCQYGRYWARLFKKRYYYVVVWGCELVAGGGWQGAQVRKASEKGGGERIRRSKDTAIFAPKDRSCANWKSHLSFNKVKGRGNFKTVREVKGKEFHCRFSVCQAAWVS
jgi:hypothetical protein